MGLELQKGGTNSGKKLVKVGWKWEQIGFKVANMDKSGKNLLTLAKKGGKTVECGKDVLKVV